MSREEKELRKVLFVDDERSILSTLQRTLRREPYEIMTCDNALDALELVSANDINVVIADQRMPDMPGTEFLQKVREISPDTVRAIISGYANADMIVDSINQGEVYRFIPKPWEVSDLKDAVNQCLRHSEVLLDNRNLIRKAHARTVELKSQKDLLENKVEQRNIILEYTQEMLEYMPVSMLGVNMKGEILLCNEHARTSMEELVDFEPGCQLVQVFGAEVSRLAAESRDMSLRACRRFNLRRGQYEFEFIPLMRSRINGQLIVIRYIGQVA